MNNIGDVGAQAIGQALEKNQVRSTFSLASLQSLIFYMYHRH